MKPASRCDRIPELREQYAAAGLRSASAKPGEPFKSEGERPNSEEPRFNSEETRFNSEEARFNSEQPRGKKLGAVDRLAVSPVK